MEENICASRGVVMTDRLQDDDQTVMMRNDDDQVHLHVCSMMIKATVIHMTAW